MLIYSPLPTAMMCPSPDAAHVTINHVVAVGPAGPVASTTFMKLSHKVDQSQAGNSLAQDVARADVEIHFPTNVVWEREPSAEQDDTSVSAQGVRMK